MMDRFHIVVSNYNKLFCFVENFHHIKGFNGQRDRIYIFDSTPEVSWQEQLAIANSLTTLGLRWGKNLYFIRRRNWGVNHGAQLDYFRCILNKTIPEPKYTAFVQEHYFDLKRFVKEDTIPEDAVYDLNKIETKFLTDSAIGCTFFSRYGIRVCASNPELDRKREFFGDGAELLPKAKRRCFCIDGGNFVVRPQPYLNLFKVRPGYLTNGDGSYGFSHVWEVRLGKILYDQGIKWADMYRNLDYSTIEELDSIEASIGEKVSMLWYDNRVWYFFYGRDIQLYAPVPFLSVLLYLWQYKNHLLSHSRDIRLTFVEP